MYNREHVERLKHGVVEWNSWRKQFSDVRPNLSGADLRRADLSLTDLSGTDLREAVLNEVDLWNAKLLLADLRGAKLTEACLIDADLRRANLGEASLSGANLGRANLRRANLSGAFLFMTNFSNAQLSYAELSYAQLRFTNLSESGLNQTSFYKAVFYRVLFEWIDLSTVKDLETVEHNGPSTININSVILPLDEQMRTHFLRGVGFTERQIEYLPFLLLPRPIQYHSIFISYAYQDDALAQRLYNFLRQQNVPCWFAPHDLRPGNYIRENIDQTIHAQDKLLLLLSEHSVKSSWVRYEVEQVLAREIRQQREILYPLRLDDAIFSSPAPWAASLRETRHIGDFTGWQEEQRYQKACIVLLRHLEVELGPIDCGEGPV